jgi:hypothetical protein
MGRLRPPFSFTTRQRVPGKHAEHAAAKTFLRMVLRAAAMAALAGILMRLLGANLTRPAVLRAPG